MIFLFSGCAGQNQLSYKSDTLRQQLKGANSHDSIEKDQELEELDPLMCTDDELNELDRTGGWDEKTSPVSLLQEEQTDFNFPVVLNKQVNMYLKLFQGRQKRQFARWLARSGKYVAMMEKELEKAGLPKDLVYLAMIESGYNPLACSRSKAVGLWQFMKATGRQYNLKVDKYVDERRDAFKSTRAAVNYLGDLYKEFGDWHLAVAAYNGGPGKVRSGLRRHKVSTFWDLASKKHLRLETKRYVPKLIATLLIAKEPKKYGFYNIVYQAPIEYETITVGPGMSLDAIALVSDSTKKEIKNLNHELRRSKTPGNVTRYEVKIPTNRAEIAQKNISRLHSIVSTGYKTHKIRKGDTLTKVCKKYGINKTTILKVNNLRSSKLTRGRNLRIPYSTISYQLLPEGSSDAMAAYRDNLVLHRIKRGDTIGKIATQYQVPQEMIVAWNGLKNAHSIRAGQQLALYIDNGKGGTLVNSASKTTTTSPSNYSVLRASKKKQPTKGRDPIFQYYHVKNGDSLWTISRKFSASTSDIKKWNNLKSNLIHPGSTLKLKKV